MGVSRVLVQQRLSQRCVLPAVRKKSCQHAWLLAEFVDEHRKLREINFPRYDCKGKCNHRTRVHKNDFIERHYRIRTWNSGWNSKDKWINDRDAVIFRDLEETVQQRFYGNEEPDFSVEIRWHPQ